jgi:hypothetical protein
VSSGFFWRVLAYVAVYHFIRQQVGWMVLYGRRNPRQTRLDDRLDRGVMVAVTLGPICWWHAALPRPFAWFVQGDFLFGTPPVWGQLAAWAGGLCLAVYLARQVWLWKDARAVPGKSLLVLTTAACWYGGIVFTQSDYVFTVTNVIIHGVPYLLLAQRYARAADHAGIAARVAAMGFAPVALICCGLAAMEEACWDRWVWHDHPAWFGAHGALPPDTLVWLVPLLAVPQLTHYLLDGYVWRVRRENPVLRRELET